VIKTLDSHGVSSFSYIIIRTTLSCKYSESLITSAHGYFPRVHPWSCHLTLLLEMSLKGTVSSLRSISAQHSVGRSSDPLQNSTVLITLTRCTTSSIAYAFSTDSGKIYTITNWPGGEDIIAPKVPTVIRYDPGSTTSFQWGYEITSLDDKITALKLLLDPDQPRPYFIPTNVEVEMAKLPKTVLEVASDYMGSVFKHALKEIKSESLDPSFLESFQKQFVLTVPAVWSDKAKDMTLRVSSNIFLSFRTLC
jgi:hypothetical protein